MPRKVAERGKIAHFFDDVSSSINASHGLEIHLEQLIRLAPEVSRKAGLTQSDIATVKQIQRKLDKCNNWIYNRTKPLLPEDIK